MRDTVKAGGHVVIATFASDGPTQCSNLNVRRYSVQDLYDEFGDGFDLIESALESHHTPWQSEQRFVYCLFRKK